MTKVNNLDLESNGQNVNNGQNGHNGHNVHNGVAMDARGNIKPPSLTKLLWVLRLFGSTFGGAKLPNEKLEPKFQSWLMYYEIFNTLGYVLFYASVTKNGMNTFAEVSNSKSMLKLVIMLGGGTRILQYIAFKYVSFFYGQKLINAITSFEWKSRINVFSFSIKVFGFIIVFTIMDGIASGMVSFGDHIITKSPFDTQESLPVPLHFFLSLVFTLPLTLLPSLMIYLSWLFTNHIRYLYYEFQQQNTNIRSLRRSLFQVKCKLQEINNIMSPSLFLTFIACTLLTISSSCTLAKTTQLSVLIFSLVVLVSDSIIVMVACCWSSEKIASEVDSLCSDLQSKITDEDSDLLANQELSFMIGMRNEIVFTASDLFYIRNSTLLSIIGIIISYTVILIQTDSYQL